MIQYLNFPPEFRNSLRRGGFSLYGTFQPGYDCSSLRHPQVLAWGLIFRLPLLERDLFHLIDLALRMRTPYALGVRE